MVNLENLDQGSENDHLATEPEEEEKSLQRAKSGPPEKGWGTNSGNIIFEDIDFSLSPSEATKIVDLFL